MTPEVFECKSYPGIANTKELRDQGTRAGASGIRSYTKGSHYVNSH